MTAARDWDEGDLKALLGSEESSNLEFKASEALDNSQKNKSELAKDVSAMANAAGGVIVYGIVEVNHLADHVDSGTTQTKEWIDQVLTSNIEPKVVGVVITRIPLATHGFAFALDIPQAVAFAPHMSKPHRQYFTRRNVTTEALLDHEVRDLQRRAAGPSLYLGFEFAPLPGVGVPDRFSLRVSIGNRTSEPALYTSIMLAFAQPALLPLPGYSGWTIETKTLRAMSDTVSAEVFFGNRAVPHAMPIFAGLDNHLISFQLNVPRNHSWRMAYSLNCPGFAERRYGNLMRRGGDPYIEFSDAPFSFE
jgi:hypothetical protein